jgi:hypothetical protein
MADSRALTTAQADALREAARELRRLSIVLELMDARRAFLEELIRESALRGFGIRLASLDGLQPAIGSISEYADCAERIANAAFDA